MVDGLELGAGAIKQDAPEATWLDIDVLDTALAFGKLGMATALAGPLGKEEGTAVALGTIAVGMLEGVARMHAQAARAQGHAIGVKPGLGDLA